ncbi:MAG TPA: carboxylating nicotinate-nucleotide diphosphorylase [Bryobacteraceae bacterium]|nr:carboxylating nicotinate-nucleotide diphosphorylase [Bryobacteraceae bacterium]
MFDVGHPEIRDAVERALMEDIGNGDITSNLTVPADLQACGSFVAKQNFILAGVEILPVIFERLGGAELQIIRESGSSISKGELIATLSGSARTLLSGERVSLNFLQRLSGVATLAGQYVDAVAGTKVKVLDTRKTTPGLRLLEKYAAAAGGVINHRQGLFDAVLIKNNHITAAGGVRNALSRVSSFKGPIEIEVRTRAEVDEALDNGAKHLLLDNLTPDEAGEWIRYIDGRATTELSGNINLETIRHYAEAEPDYISSGAITHSAAAVDISFRLELEPRMGQSG